eukprot:NODE_549_length_6180_cov_0.430357.p4 type:complete len:179 gc:universal NODE_549_length_6180_cov_0.430357:2692-2156(-)
MSSSSISLLSSKCQVALFTISDCMQSVGTRIPSDRCDKCRNSTEAIFTKCNSKDFKYANVRMAALQCHQEDGKDCGSESMSESKIDLIGCPNKCSQFFAKMYPLWETDKSNADLHGQLQQVRDCAAKYPNDTKFEKLATVTGKSNNSTNSTTDASSNDTSSAATTSFTVLTLSTLMLV